MTRLIIYGAPVSTWTRTVCMTALEKGLEYELQFVARAGADHLALHPFGRYPAVELDGQAMFETLAITAHLDENFDGPALQAEDPTARTRMRTWMGVCSDYVFRDVVQMIPRGRATSEEEFATARGVLENLEALMDPGPFLAGDALTLADLYLAPQISGAAEKAPTVLDGLDKLGAWMAPMRERPSFQATAYDPAVLVLPTASPVAPR
jgi:glutathione S-transferase